jgi:hypothetical protein
VKQTATGHETFGALTERDRDDTVISLALGCWYAEAASTLYPDLSHLQRGRALSRECAATRPGGISSAWVPSDRDRKDGGRKKRAGPPARRTGPDFRSCPAQAVARFRRQP